jgi:hypothetical protein
MKTETQGFAATRGFAAQDLDQVAALVGGGAHDLAGMAGTAPAVPDAGASSAAVAGVLHALAGVVGSIVGTADTAAGYVRSGDRGYRDVDGAWASGFASVRSGLGGAR